MKNKIIVAVTTIASPNKVINMIATMSDRHLVVSGDKKTPDPWVCENVDYISFAEQNKNWRRLAKEVPINSYPRKMFAYLKAIQQGAEIIIDTDDDNIPTSNWLFPDFFGDYEVMDREPGFINIYQLFTDKKIWPRGLPLQLINTDFELREKVFPKKSIKIGVWQALADGDPDVDAFYRLTDGSMCTFDKREPIVLNKKVISPFNSQNTATSKELFSLLYLPISVTFRFTDILRGLVAQPIMWLYDLHLGFQEATVLQERNAHNLYDDLADEVFMYRHASRIVEWVTPHITADNSVEDNLYQAYRALHRKKVVESEELQAVEAWLTEIQAITKN